MKIIFSQQIGHENRTKYGQQITDYKKQKKGNPVQKPKMAVIFLYVSKRIKIKTTSHANCEPRLSTTDKTRQIDSLTVFGDVM